MPILSPKSAIFLKLTVISCTPYMIKCSVTISKGLGVGWVRFLLCAMKNVLQNTQKGFCYNDIHWRLDRSHRYGS